MSCGRTFAHRFLPLFLALCFLLPSPVLAEGDLVRPFGPQDCDQVLNIEKLSSAKAWSPADFSREQKKPNVFSRVVERNGQVLGYVIYEMTATHIRIIRLAVAPEFRRQKVGTLLIQELIARLNPDGRSELFLVVDADNFSARAVCAAVGLFEQKTDEGKVRIWMRVRDLSKADAVALLEGQTLYERLDVPEDANEQILAEGHRRSLVFAKDNEAAAALLHNTYSLLSDAAFRARYDEKPGAYGPIAPKPALERDETGAQSELIANPFSDDPYARLGASWNMDQGQILDLYIDAFAQNKTDTQAQRNLTSAFQIIGKKDTRRAFHFVAENRDRLAGRLKEEESRTLWPDPYALDLYERLGISENSPPEVVELEANLLLLTFANDADAVVLLASARNVLLNPQKRALYNIERDDLRAVEAILNDTTEGEFVIAFLDRLIPVLPILFRNHYDTDEFFGWLRKKTDDWLDTMPRPIEAIALIDRVEWILHNFPPQLRHVLQPLRAYRSELAMRLFNQLARNRKEQLILYRAYGPQRPSSTIAEMFARAEPMPSANKEWGFGTREFWQRQIDASYFTDEGFRRPGLLGGVGTPQKFSFATVIGAASLSFWAAVAVLPGVVFEPLKDFAMSFGTAGEPVVEGGKIVSALLAANYGGHVVNELLNASKRTWFRARRSATRLSEPHDAPAEPGFCGRLLESIFTAYKN